MLDVGDNLERAYSAVPQEALQGKDKQGNKLSADAAVQLLISLTNGVKLTEKIFDSVSLEMLSWRKLRLSGLVSLRMCLILKTGLT